MTELSDKTPSLTQRLLKRPLLLILIGSLVLHLIGGLILGSWKIFTILTEEETEIEVVTLPEAIQPQQREYKMKTMRSQRSTAISTQVPIAVDQPLISICRTSTSPSLSQIRRLSCTWRLVPSAAIATAAAVSRPYSATLATRRRQKELLPLKQDRSGESTHQRMDGYWQRFYAKLQAARISEVFQRTTKALCYVFLHPFDGGRLSTARLWSRAVQTQ